jgi:cobalt transporter subunit CbtA
MFRNIVFSAFGAGLAVCVAVSALQFFTTEPLILQAEQFEGAEALAHEHNATTTGGSIVLVHEVVGGHEHDEEAWSPADGLERTAYTVLANLVIGVGVSLMLLGGIVLKGDPIDWRCGLLWGVGGFVAVSLLPSLGLPPELPGTPAAEISSRQGWWLGAATASVGGVALIVFAAQWPARVAGVLLLIAPHIVGAPMPPTHEVSYPGALAGEFVAASLVVSGLLWTLSGAASGWLLQRLSRGG